MPRCLLVVAVCASALAQDALLSRPDVKKAFAWLQANHDATVAKQIQIAEVPAPTFDESKRAALMAAEFKRVGLSGVEIDPKGNVLGWRRGASAKALVIAAHLDTVFPASTDLKVKKNGVRLNGPGLADDSRGLAALLALAEALREGAFKTKRTLLFVANVGEEGLGDLNGVKYLLKEGKYKDQIEAFISIDGTGPERIVNGGLASKRYRITVKGPGGHSYGNFGRPSPIHALGRMIGHFATLPVPEKPKTTYNVGLINGGTSINSIAYEASMEVDMRSESEAELQKLEDKFLKMVRIGVEEENHFRAKSGARLEYDARMVGYRAGGVTPVDSPLVKSAMRAADLMKVQPRLAISSTDANVPIGMGMPGITVGGGGRSGDHHSLNEWFDPTDAYKGVQQVLLTVLAFDGV